MRTIVVLSSSRSTSAYSTRPEEVAELNLGRTGNANRISDIEWALRVAQELNVESHSVSLPHGPFYGVSGLPFISLSCVFYKLPRVQQLQLQCGALVLSFATRSQTLESVSQLSTSSVPSRRGQEAMEVVMGIFPTCWELEAMDGRNADGAEDAIGDMYVRYVYGSLGEMCVLSLTFRRYVFSIRPGVPHSDMALGFKENEQRVLVNFLNCQPHRRAFSSEKNCTDFSVKCTGEYGHLLAAEPAWAAVGRKFNFDYDDAYDRDNCDNHNADCSRRCLR